MNQIEIIKAILAGEALDIKWRDIRRWQVFSRSTSNIEIVLNLFISQYDRYSWAEFRIKPKVKTYQSRAYILDDANIFYWVSTNTNTPQSQDEFITRYGNRARWIEETQTKEYV